MVQFDLLISASSKWRRASSLAASITELLRTGSAAAFANQPTLAQLVPGDYTIRHQPVMSARSRRDVADTDDTAASTTLQEQLDEVQRKLAAAEAAHAEERAMLQAARAEEKAANAEEKAALTTLLATGKDYTPWFIAIACIQVRSHPMPYYSMHTHPHTRAFHSMHRATTVYRVGTNNADPGCFI